MSLIRTLSDLSTSLKRQLLVLIALPIIAAGGYLVVRAYTAALLIGACIVTVVTFEAIARQINIDRAGARQRRVLSVGIAASGLALVLIGTVVLLAGNAAWPTIAIGGVIGAFLAVDAIGLTWFAEDRQLLARSLLISLLVIVIVAALLGLGHLLGMGIAAVEATLAASGFLGIFLVYAAFTALDVHQ